jgi:hypothetical protein
MNQNRQWILVILMFCSCAAPPRKRPSFASDDISRIITRMSDLMVRDITNPPLAARFFAYTCLAGYEVIVQNDTGFASMQGKLRDYPIFHHSDSIQRYDVQLSAILAMLETAGKMQPSGYLVKQYEKKWLDSCKDAGFDEEVLNRSRQYAAAISAAMLAYAKADGYNTLSNYARYTPMDKDGTWYPTPPGFMGAIEPYFSLVRPFTLDSATQFKSAPPVPFSTDKHSSFYRLMLLNYKDTLPHAEATIAAFWDCNPFALQDNGHLMSGIKKISPGAHWMGITGIACRNARKSFEQSMYIHTIVAVGLMDAFICCWEEKYRTNRIRPETAIRKYIDPSWKPFLQSPPFPEYISGHSVISATSGILLTHLLGDHFPFRDSVEASYGLPPRSFPSFMEAATEAGLSRFYGGIHFMDAIVNGKTQGVEVGEWVWSRIK